MKIVLKPMPQTEGETCIGTADGKPLVYRGRDLYVGERLLPLEEIGPDLVDAVDRAATEVLGNEWINPLARLVLINRRSVSKDRIARFGLPEYVMLFLGEASHHPIPRALGHALLCVEAIQDAQAKGAILTNVQTGRLSREDLDHRNARVHDSMARALSLVDEVLAHRRAFSERKPRPVTDD